ncbi:MAG: carbon-nitrogen hydrolase family protein [Rhodospirillales bacterium]
MADTFKAACVQNCASDDMDATLKRARELVIRARGEGADLIAVPEFFACLDVGVDGLETGAQPEDGHPAVGCFSDLARETGAWILVGSIAVNEGRERSRNRSLMLDPHGKIQARYDKIHMFDVDLGKGESYRESDRFEPGTHAVLSPTPWGPLGMSVCYDLRFAYLYRALAKAGALFLSCPAAFMKTTGEAHWHTLLRARAIETGCYMIAPCQNGKHGRANTYGHSLIVDPWGAVIAEGDGDNEDVIIAEIDPAKVHEARSKVPALQHDRLFDMPDASTLKLAGE